jgi:hypothetical protein
MKNLLKIPKKHMHFYLLSLVMILFIVFPVEIPSELGGMLDSMLGKLIIVVLVLNLFMAHPVVGAIGAVAAYELIRRSSGMAGIGSTMMKQYVPSEKKRTASLNSFNQFPITVEEMVVKSKVPYTFNMSLGDIDNATFKPILGDTHEAEDV